jgi:hypothetical protein
MTKRTFLTFIFSFLPLIVVAQIPYRPYLGQNPPGSVPEVFAPGLVSRPGRRDTKIVFAFAGSELVDKTGGLLPDGGGIRNTGHGPR